MGRKFRILTEIETELDGLARELYRAAHDFGIPVNYGIALEEGLRRPIAATHSPDKESMETRDLGELTAIITTIDHLAHQVISSGQLLTGKEALEFRLRIIRALYLADRFLKRLVEFFKVTQPLPIYDHRAPLWSYDSSQLRRDLVAQHHDFDKAVRNAAN